MAASHSAKDDLTVEQVRAALDYNPETGVFIRKARAELPHFINKRCAGKPAGSVVWYPGKPNKKYLAIKLYGRSRNAHRLAWLLFYGEWPAGHIDHINGNSLDNRIANLRLATNSQNHMNQRVRRDSKLGLKGVHRVGNRFQARIQKDGKRLNLGLFGTPEEAHAAYCKAAHEMFGEFARTT